MNEGGAVVTDRVGIHENLMGVEIPDFLTCQPVLQSNRVHLSPEIEFIEIFLIDLNNLHVS